MLEKNIFIARTPKKPAQIAGKKSNFNELGRPA
jgi:hypothetical protein